MPRFVFLFSELDEVEEQVDGDWDRVQDLLGGKGANLADMTRLRLPVPPGFTATTEACNAYLEAGGGFPEGFREEALASLSVLEEQSGKRFGDPKAPLLLSCRSGSRVSMPGMMDTVLNLGLNDEIVEAMALSNGDARFAYDLYRRLLHMFGSVVLNIDDHAFEQVVEERRSEAGVTLDADLTGEDWREVCDAFKSVVRTYSGRDFPLDPVDQLLSAVEAVPRRHHRGQRARRGLPGFSPGRGRRFRHARHRVRRSASGSVAGAVRGAGRHRQQARDPLPEHAGHRVHHRARKAVDPANA